MSLIKFLLVFLLCWFVLARFSGFIFRGIFTLLGRYIYKKVLRQAQQQGYQQAYQQPGYEHTTYQTAQEEVTISSPKKEKAPEKRPYKGDEGEYIPFEEVK